MKLIRTLMSAGCFMLLLAACSGAWSDNRKAASYADRIEKGESISAEDYVEIVEFYCQAIDRGLAELAPLDKEHSRAVDSGNHELAARTSKALARKSAEVAAKRKDLTRLGSQLYIHLNELPDSTRARLIDYLSSLNSRYTNY